MIETPGTERRRIATRKGYRGNIGGRRIRGRCGGYERDWKRKAQERNE